MEAFNSLIPSLSGTNILDVGCGIGSLAINMAKAKPGSIIYGVDIIDGSIEQCRLNARIENVFNTNFTVASAYELPFEKEYFDTVTCFFMLHHLDDVAKALKDIKRVLKPSGQVFAVEPIDHFHDVQRGPEDWKSLFLEAGYNVKTWENNDVTYIHAVLK
jgi:ubiquinone/menaquinone biosynthesis C-methylase UbiE